VTFFYEKIANFVINGMQLLKFEGSYW